MTTTPAQQLNAAGWQLLPDGTWRSPYSGFPCDEALALQVMERMPARSIVPEMKTRPSPVSGAKEGML